MVKCALFFHITVKIGNKPVNADKTTLLLHGFPSVNRRKIGQTLIQYWYQYQDNLWLQALKEKAIPIHLCWYELDAVAPIVITKKLINNICC